MAPQEERNMRVLKIDRSTSTGHRLLHYDGVCGSVHGHNMLWEIAAGVEFDQEDETAMPVDLKDISDVIDDVDHAVLLNEEDPLLEHEADLGEVYTFEQDPTCENVSQWMADRIVELVPEIKYVQLTLYETEKYGITTEAHDD